MKKYTTENMALSGHNYWSLPGDCDRHVRIVGFSGPGPTYAATVKVYDFSPNLGEDWFSESKNGFETIAEALAWGVDVLNDIDLRIACERLERAFDSMSELLGAALSYADDIRAESASAERGTCLKVLGDLCDQVQAQISGSFLQGQELYEHVAARTVLDRAIVEIGARGANVALSAPAES